MEWKSSLRILEINKQWDDAIGFMQEVIRQNPHDMDAYIAMNYLVMNLLVEEDYDNEKRDYYIEQLQKYFEESYDKFSDNAEYLYYTCRIASMSEWFVNLTSDDVNAMRQRAIQLDPFHPIYKSSYYHAIARKNPENKELLAYVHSVLDKNSFIQKTLKAKGAIGAYLLDMMTYWAQNVIEKKTVLL